MVPLQLERKTKSEETLIFSHFLRFIYDYLILLRGLVFVLVEV